MTDQERLIDGLNPSSSFDVTPYKLTHEKLVSANDIDGVYSAVPRAVYDAYKDGGWFQFYHKEQLHDLLSATLMPILKLAHKWSVTQEDVRKQPIVKPKPMSKEKTAQIQHDLDQMLKKL